MPGIVIPIESCDPLTSFVPGSLSYLKRIFASFSGFSIGRQAFHNSIAFLRVDVAIPERSLKSIVGSIDAVTAQPPPNFETYGWSIHVPARSILYGIGVSFLKVVEDRTGRLA